jgi:hypothetical protein
MSAAGSLIAGSRIAGSLITGSQLTAMQTSIDFIKLISIKALLACLCPLGSRII